jgi:hypothetical protein
MQVFRNRHIVDTVRLDKADFTLTQALREAAGQAAHVREAVEGKKVPEIRLAIECLLSNDPSFAPQMAQAADAIGRSSIQKLVAKFILDRRARFLPEDAAWANEALRRAER